MEEENKKASQGARNKRVGSEAERYYMRIFRDELGFKHCKTARLGSKLHDNAGIDLIFIPFNIQVKQGIQSGLNPSKELQKMKDKMVELFPDTSLEHDYPKLVIHKKQIGRGNRATEFDEIVTMTFSDFKKLLSK